MILILKTGSTIESFIAQHGDFENWITDKLGLPESAFRVHFAGDYRSLPPDIEYSGIIITGSPLMVTDLYLKGSSLCNWLLDKQQKEVPILGICFGHQLLNVINGGSVKNNPGGLIIGSESTYLTPDGQKDLLLGGLPLSFKTFKTHTQSVDDVPESAQILATNQLGIIDAIRFAPKSWSVQFHPEFNPEIMKLYIEHKRDHLSSKGIQVDELQRNAEIIDYGKQLFDRFKEITKAKNDN